MSALPKRFDDVEALESFMTEPSPALVADLAAAASQEATNLEQSGQMSSSGTKKLRYQTRKLTQKLPEL